MLNRTMLSATLIAAALAGAPMAFAATSTDATGTSPNALATSSDGQKAMTSSSSQRPAAGSIRFISLDERVTPEDVAAFGTSQVSLDEAIADAQRTTKGTAVDAVFEAVPGKPHYVVWLTKGDRLYRSTVDAQSGAVASADHGFALHRLNPSERADVGAVEQAKASLADAVAIAAKDSNGKPIAAFLEREEGVRAYHVAVIEKGALQSVWVSPNNPMAVASK
jgi:uncharacterized membrane protein YkoI